jgi:hypothetical protein
VPLDFRVGIVLMLVVLSAAVVVLAVTDRGGTKTETVVTKTVADGELRSRVAALGESLTRSSAATRADVAALATTVKALQAKVAVLQARKPRPVATPPPPSAAIHDLQAGLQTVRQCLFQVQKQLDDLQGYALTRNALHKRVSGACLQILHPRFAAQ